MAPWSLRGKNGLQHIGWRCQNFFTEYRGKGQKLKEIRKLYCICYVRPENQMTELLKKPREESILRSTRNVLVRGVLVILRILVVAALCKPK